MKIQLSEKEIAGIKTILQKFSKINEVRVFGSRAIGKAKPGSDIDIALKGLELGFQDILKISQALDELYLPYKIDLLIYADIENPALKEHIDKYGIVLIFNS